jgi:hypothetical protein
MMAPISHPIGTHRMLGAQFRHMSFLEDLAAHDHLIGVSLTMKAIVSCPHCNRPHRVAKTAIGKKGKCSGCKSVFVIQTTCRYSEAFAYALDSIRADKQRTQAKPLASTDQTTECASAALLTTQAAKRTASSKWTKFDLSRFDIGWFLACIAAVVCGPFIIVSGVGEQRKETLWTQGTGTTQGFVTKAYEQTEGPTRYMTNSRYRTRYRTYYRVDVSYTVGGIPYELKNQDVSFSLFSRHDSKLDTNWIGSTEQGVEVEYATADPSVAKIKGGRFDSLPTILFGVFLFVVGILGMCYYFIPDRLSLEN